MGLLREDRVLSWEETSARTDEIKKKGIEQFIAAYKLHRNSRVRHLAFGDELELMMVGKEDGRWKLMFGSREVIEDLKMPGLALEYANYMLEITAKVPYDMESYAEVEAEMLRKISMLTKYLKEKNEDGYVLMCSVFPNLSETFFPRQHINGSCLQRLSYEITNSETFPDEGITDHNRFVAFTQNIRNRRRGETEGYVEVMRDPDGNQKCDEYVKIDSMGQGMGCCCLQVTVQASDLDEGRLVYDMLGALCPIMLRMTAGSPIAQGKLLNTETRWDILWMSVDCRTSAERGKEFDVSGFSTKELPAPIPKSRFSSIDLFISEDRMNLKEYNDLYPPLHKESYDTLVENGVDERMAEHVASLFIRDPILSYERMDGGHRDDFENIQSSNWRSMRLKLPEEDAKDVYRGFKVETRVMEVQATAFENAAFVYFNLLLSRAIVEYRCNFYIPLSLVDENFRRSNLLTREKKEYFNRLSEDKQKFYYRANMFDEGAPVIMEGTVSEILNGNDSYRGILSVLRDVIKEKFGNDKRLHRYIDFIEKKSKGAFMSLSDWVRRFVLTHASYKNDSNVGDAIVSDLIDRLKAISAKNEVDYLENR